MPPATPKAAPASARPPRRVNTGGKPKKSPASTQLRRSSDVKDVPGASGAAPANLRAVPQRPATAVCDSVSVASRFDGHSRCSALSPDGTAWTGETDGSITVRLAPSGVTVHRIEPFGRATVLVMANIRGRMWAGFSDGALRVFDHTTQTVLLASTQHTAAVYALCAADGYVYTGGADWKVYQWEEADLHFCRMYHGHRNTVRCLTAYTDHESGRRYVVSGSDDGAVKVWEAASGASTKAAPSQERDTGCIATLEGQGRCVLSLLVLEDTAELWTGSEDAAIRVWDLYSMTVTSVITAHRTPVATLQRVEDTVWSGSKDGAIAITNRFSKELVHYSAQPAAPGGGGGGGGSTNAGAGAQRFHMSILPVTRTIVYNVWATAADGSWQCWNFTAPEGPQSTPDEADAYVDAHHVLQLSASATRRRHHTPPAGATTPHAHGNGNGRGAAIASANGADEDLRESVARTRRSMAVLLAEPFDASPGEGSSTGRLRRYSGSAVSHRSEDDAAAADGVDEDGSSALDAVAESIRNDHAAETRREVEAQQATLAKELQRSAELRAELMKIGEDPAVIAAEGARSVTAQPEPHTATAEAAARRHSGLANSPTTQQLLGVSSQVELVKAENRAMAAAARRPAQERKTVAAA